MSAFSVNLMQHDWQKRLWSEEANGAEATEIIYRTGCELIEAHSFGETVYTLPNCWVHTPTYYNYDLRLPFKIALPNQIEKEAARELFAAMLLHPNVLDRIEVRKGFNSTKSDLGIINIQNQKYAVIYMPSRLSITGIARFVHTNLLAETVPEILNGIMATTNSYTSIFRTGKPLDDESDPKYKRIQQICLQKRDELMANGSWDPSIVIDVNVGNYLKIGDEIINIDAVTQYDGPLVN